MPRGFEDNHNFSVGDVVRLIAGTFTLAQSTGLSVIRGVVDAVIDEDTFNYVREGRMRFPGHGLTIDAVYYISSAVAGGVITPQPVTGQQDPIFYVSDDKNIEVIGSSGGATVYRRDFDDGDLATDILAVTHNLNKRYPHITVWRNTNIEVNDDLILGTATGVDGLTIDFTGLTPLTGTWHLIVSV